MLIKQAKQKFYYLSNYFGLTKLLALKCQENNRVNRLQYTAHAQHNL